MESARFFIFLQLLFNTIQFIVKIVAARWTFFTFHIKEMRPIVEYRILLKGPIGTIKNVVLKRQYTGFYSANTLTHQSCINNNQRKIHEMLALQHFSNFDFSPNFNLGMFLSLSMYTLNPLFIKAPPVCLPCRAKLARHHRK